MIDKTKFGIITDCINVQQLGCYNDLTSPQNDDKLKANKKLQGEIDLNQHAEQRGKNCLSAKTNEVTIVGGFNGR